MYCTTNSTLRLRFLLKILQITQIQTTAASSLLQPNIGDAHGALMLIVLSVKVMQMIEVSSHLEHRSQHRALPL